jgi:hypothetical protein
MPAFCSLALGESRHFYGAGADIGEAEDRMQHRRLAGAVRADEADRLAARGAQREIVQDLHAAIAGAQVLDRDERLVSGKPVQVRRRRRLAGDGARLPHHLVDGDDRRDRAFASPAGALARRRRLGRPRHQVAPR